MKSHSFSSLGLQNGLCSKAKMLYLSVTWQFIGLDDNNVNVSRLNCWLFERRYDYINPQCAEWIFWADRRIKALSITCQICKKNGKKIPSKTTSTCLHLRFLSSGWQLTLSSKSRGYFLALRHLHEAAWGITRREGKKRVHVLTFPNT